MRLIQFIGTENQRQVGLVVNERVFVVEGVETTYEMARLASEGKTSLANLASSRAGSPVAYEEIIRQKRILSPVDHPQPSRLMVSGTGLTHLGSAETRDKMHQKISVAAETALTDSMLMFKRGLDGGKPAKGLPGVQPEWFYKGNGDIVIPPEGPLTRPSFALDGGEEPEIVGIYWIADDGSPRRLGYALGNEFSDHATENQNYLYLSHSKLRPCSFGPELLLGDLPANLVGASRIYRDGQIEWEKAFLTGQSNMCHSLENIEYHHFKYKQHRRPGDLHIHFFGTATLSYSDGFQPQSGDIFEIVIPEFGHPLRNSLVWEIHEEYIQVAAL